MIAGFIFSSVILLAQSKLSGSINDVEGNPIPGANVILLQAKDSSMVKGVVTATSGSYSFENVEPGKFLIVSSMIGYKKMYSPVDVTGKVIQLPPVFLKRKYPSSMKLPCGRRLQCLNSNGQAGGEHQKQYYLGGKYSA
ncbi:MAG: carboxypeptidase-like regulatory domain-containing protein [Bacteroidota bacterium]